MYSSLVCVELHEKGERPVWGLSYSAKEMYSLTDMSPKSWNNLAERSEVT